MPLTFGALLLLESLTTTWFSELLTMTPKESATSTAFGERSLLANNHEVFLNERAISKLVGSSPLDVQCFQRSPLILRINLLFLCLFVSLSKRQLQFRAIQYTVIHVFVHEEALENLLILVI